MVIDLVQLIDEAEQVLARCSRNIALFQALLPIYEAVPSRSGLTELAGIGEQFAADVRRFAELRELLIGEVFRRLKIE